MWRSIVAIVVGFVLIGAVSVGTHAALSNAIPGYANSAGMPSTPQYLMLSLVVIGVIAVAGCYLTARLAPDRPMRHALILGVLGLLFNIFGTMQTWNAAPVWYHVIALALVMPYAWLGGRIRERQLERGHRSGSAPLAA